MNDRTLHVLAISPRAGELRALLRDCSGAEHSVLACPRPEDAPEHALDHGAPLDCVVLDGRGEGELVEVIARLRRSVRLEHAPLVVIAEPGDRGAKLRAAGASAVLRPALLAPASLAAVIEEAVGACEQRDRDDLAKLRSFLDKAPHPMGVVEIAPGGEDLLHVIANEGTVRWYDELEGGVEGKWALADLDGPRELTARVVAHYEQARREGEVVHYSVPTPDGGLLAISVAHLGPGEAGRERYCYLIIDDTERERAEAELRLSEERLRLAAEAARFGTYDFEVASGESYWSPELARLVGRPELRRARGEDILTVVHPDDRARFQELVAASTDPEGPGRHELEYRIRRPDGEVRWVQDSGQAVVEDGEVVRVVGLFQDVTERKRATLALEEADRRKDEFLATLAHELRNPLAPLRTGLELMDMAPDDAVAVARAREAMKRQVRLLTRLVDDLLDLSRITRAKLELRREPTRLADVLDTAVDSALTLIEARGHALELDLDDVDTVLEIDGARVTQVVANLLNNAAKYTPPGGRLGLSSERRGDLVVLRVRDEGEGIPAAMHEQIFEMFTQAGPATNARTGLGVGLTLVRRLVELHGGSVRLAASAPGEGSVFEVALPIGSARVDAAASGARRSRPSATRRVLVADDNREITEILALALEQAGVEVRVAGNGREAFERAEAFRPQIVIMDLGMPELDGYAAARAIRRESWGREMVLVALSGWGRSSDREQTQAAGFDHHLVKPAEFDELLALVDSI